MLCRVRQGFEIWLGLPGAIARFAGAYTGDMLLTTVRPSILPGTPRHGLRPYQGGSVSPRGFSWGVTPCRALLLDQADEGRPAQDISRFLRSGPNSGQTCDDHCGHVGP